jgi:hypothetical protein
MASACVRSHYLVERGPGSLAHARVRDDTGVVRGGSFLHAFREAESFFSRGEEVDAAASAAADGRVKWGCAPCTEELPPPRFRAGTPSLREGESAPPHAVRRWMQQRQLLQTEELGWRRRPAQKNSLPRACSRVLPHYVRERVLLLTQ